MSRAAVPSPPSVDEALSRFPTSSVAVEVPLELIDESPFNQRSVWGDESYEDFRPGVKIPALGRLKPDGRVELVFGARRFRGSKFHKFPTLPMTLKQLTDAQVRELQVIENFRRNDGHFLDEAHWYRDMHDLDGLTNEQIAKKIGGLPNYVATRIRIARLPDEAKELCRQGLLDIGRALLVSRVDEGRQVEAAQIVADKVYQSGDGFQTQEVRISEARRLIAKQFSLQIKNAPWPLDDADLSPEAGPCSSCPHNSGAKEDLLGEFSGAGLCMKADCYHDKNRRFVSLSVDRAKSDGRVVHDFTGRSWQAAEEFLEKPSWRPDYLPQDGFLDAKDICMLDDAPTERTFEEILGPDRMAQLSILVVDPDGVLHTLLKDSDELIDALKAGGMRQADPDDLGRLSESPSPRPQPTISPEEKDRLARNERMAVAHAKARTQLLEAISKQPPTLETTVRILAMDAHANDQVSREAQQRYGIGPDVSITTLPLARQAGALVESVALINYYRGNDYGRPFEVLCEAYGIDLKALEEGKTNAAKKPKAKAKGKKKPTKGHYIRGICRRCLCAEKGACAGGCSWTDETETLCTACVDGDGNQLPPVEKKPAPKKPSAPKTKARKPTQQTLPAVKAPAKGKKKPTKGRR